MPVSIIELLNSYYCCAPWPHYGFNPTPAWAKLDGPAPIVPSKSMFCDFFFRLAPPMKRSESSSESWSINSWCRLLIEVEHRQTARKWLRTAFWSWSLTARHFCSCRRRCPGSWKFLSQIQRCIAFEFTKTTAILVDDKKSYCLAISKTYLRYEISRQTLTATRVRRAGRKKSPLPPNNLLVGP